MCSSDLPHFTENARFVLGLSEGLKEIGEGILNLVLVILKGLLYEFFGNLVADRSWNEQFHAFFQQLVKLPWDAVSGKISDDFQKALLKADRDLYKAEDPREQGKALVKYAEVISVLFGPEFIAKYLKEPPTYGYKPTSGLQPLTKADLDSYGMILQREMTAAQAGELMGYKPKGNWILSHAEGVPVLLTKTTREMYLVRLGKEGSSGPQGQYFARLVDIKGMTPKEIKKYLNLDFVPDVFQRVTIPQGQELLISGVGKQPYLRPPMKSDAGLQFQIKLPDGVEIKSKKDWFSDWIEIGNRL